MRQAASRREIVLGSFTFIVTMAFLFWSAAIYRRFLAALRPFGKRPKAAKRRRP
jgi:hypothetical protein